VVALREVVGMAPLPPASNRSGVCPAPPIPETCPPGEGAVVRLSAMSHAVAVPLTPGERIARIRESATLLDKQEWSDIDLVLSQHLLPTTDDAWQGSKAQYIVEMIRDAPDNKLNTLHQYLIDDALDKPVSQSPWSGTKLRVFFSHSATHRQLVSEVGESLALYGVEPFIAHDAIEPSAEWVSVIESALTECDALVAFLHPETPKSQWCEQEIGWALGCKRPVLPLSFGLNPYGLLGKYQAQDCHAFLPHRIGPFIIDWLTRNPSLLGRLSTGLVDAFVHSGSWSFTRSIVPLLERIESVTDDDLTRMESAARGNVDVRECSIPPNLTGPEWVARYVKKRRGPTSMPDWPDPEVPF